MLFNFLPAQILVRSHFFQNALLRISQNPMIIWNDPTDTYNANEIDSLTTLLFQTHEIDRQIPKTMPPSLMLMN